MNTIHMRVTGRLLISGFLVLVALAAACVPISPAPTTDDGLVQLDDGVVKVKDDNGEWLPVAGTSTFELVGELESDDPWTVAGVALETNELTQIEEGLQTGAVVRVQGTVLEDGTWVAYSIALAEEGMDPGVILIGVVDSIDPWVVNGIELTVNDETVIQGDIAPGTIVRVEFLLLPDGTREALSIALLGDPIEASGCVTVIAKILRVDGDQIRFEGWPMPVTLVEDDHAENDENENEGEEGEDEDEDEDGDEDADDEENGAETIQPGQTLLAVVCISEDGRLVVVQITLLGVEEDEENTGDEFGGGEKVLVCHNTSKNNPHTISIAQPAVPAHLAHGDTLGPCP